MIWQKIGPDLTKEPRHNAIAKSAVVGLLAAFLVLKQRTIVNPIATEINRILVRLKVNGSVYLLDRLI
jgi:hypothetical protein